MWSVEQIESIPIELDFSSSGQGRRSATAIESGGVRLVNAVELLDVEPSATQVEKCECCGFSGCRPGGWVAFRRVGDSVVWIPAWNMMEKGPWELSEYTPPSFLSRRGTPVFSADSWDWLRAIHAGFPAAEALPVLDSREAARLCQWAAPGRVLGQFPAEPRMRRQLLIAVTEGELATEADAVDQCLQENYVLPRPMETVPTSIPVVPIELWLDLPGTPGWRAFARVHDQVCFLVEGSLALMREGGLTAACS